MISAQLLGVRRAAHRDARALEVARLADAEVLERHQRQLVAEHGAHLVGPPDVELALDALGVGVQRGREAALGLAQLAQRPVERLRAHAREQRLAATPASRAGRRAPAARCRRASSRSAGRSSARRRCSGRSRRRSGRTCRRRPSGAACAAPSGARPGAAGTRSPRPAGTSARRPSRRARRRRPRRSAVTASSSERGSSSSSGGSSAAAPAQPRQDLRGRLLDLRALLDPGVGDALEHLPPARHAVARLGREVRAGVERDGLGRQERVQRPAAVAGHRLHRVHVDRVDVRALLAVDLHAHEALVHERRRLGVLEGLALHHVAPVAGRVADRDQQRPVELARAAQRLLAPREPVDRVLRVLEQVGGRLVGESVRHGPR